MPTSSTLRRLLAGAALVIAAGCQSVPDMPLPLADAVDLERFSGDWYVIGGILTPFEDDAYNPVETYRLLEDDVVATTFAFNRGGFDGERVEYHPRGYVRPDTGNAVWGMQFIWPIRADYRIVRLADDYSQVVIGRRARDYVWVMARQPEMSERAWNETVEFLVEIGYHREAIGRAPQQSLAERGG